MQALNLKPTHKLVKNYYETLGQYGQVNIDCVICAALYRHLQKCFVYFDRHFNEEVYSLPIVYPPTTIKINNSSIVTTTDGQIDFSTQMVNCIPCAHLDGRPSQVFPFYTLMKTAPIAREHSDWALNEFRAHYHDRNITKWDILRYVYAVLHHPAYRERYAANWKRELPRIPFVQSAGGERGSFDSAALRSEVVALLFLCERRC